jgi:hypothetical protein
MPRGSICEEIEQLLNMRHQTVSARRTDLRRAGYTDYLRDVDGIILRRPTTTDSPAAVEVATKKGKMAIAYDVPLQLNGGDPTEGRHGGNPTSKAAFGNTSRSHDARRVLAAMCKFS